jgi:hypothetical protein
VSKKAHPSVTTGTIFAEPCPILSWVKPALKYSMSIFTHVPTSASPFSKIRAWHTAVMKLPGVSPSSILSRMNKRTLSPIMRVCPRTRTDLERKHAEFICGIYTVFYIRE